MTTGCRNCFFRTQKFGERFCTKKPHDYVTEEQRRIVEWLTRVFDDAMDSNGCPGFLSR